MTRPDILFFKQCGYSSTELPEIAVKFLMHAVYVRIQSDHCCMYVS